MILHTNLDEVPPAEPLVAAVDVEWTKNYRVKNGSTPFCYSIVWLTSGPAEPVFRYRSIYVESAEETQDLIQTADRDLGALAQTSTLIAGHQLCSDLATLANAAHHPTPGIEKLRQRWRARRTTRPVPLVDTRYDLGHLLVGSSRRLVDVCTELGLDVTQPELRGTSMTALHRRWLQHGDPLDRERITVLNLRHSLSTALIAHQPHTAQRPATLNVNDLLFRTLSDAIGWTRSPHFTRLLEQSHAGP